MEAGAGTVDRHCGSGSPPEELVKVAEEVEADLVAIGSDGYICNGRVVVGRVARRVLAEAPIPVLATPVVTSLEGPFPELPDGSTNEPVPITVP